MNIQSVLLILLLIIASCSSGDEGTSTPLTVDELSGTYTLTAFSVTYTDGSTSTNEDYTSYSGGMVLTSSGNLYQVITISGESVYNSGLYAIATSSSITFNSDSNLCSSNLGISIQENTLTMTRAANQCGYPYDDILTWTYVSNDETPLFSQNNDPIVDSGILDEVISGDLFGW